MKAGAKYKQDLQQLLQTLSKIQWQIADLLEKGKNNFPETYKAAYRGLADSYVLETWRRKSQKIKPATRRADLSFALHMEVAELSTLQQKNLLNLAATEQMTPKQLRAHIRRKQAIFKIAAKEDKLRAAYLKKQKEHKQ